MRALAVLVLIGCAAPQNDEPPVDTGNSEDGLPGYAFAGRVNGADSVSYDGQVFRHVLIDAMAAHLAGLTPRLDQDALVPAEGDVAAELDFYFAFDDATAGPLPHGLELEPPAAQATFDAISSGKDLVQKLAGNDPVGQHADWSNAFVGWPGAGSPEALIRAWFQQIDDAAVGWSTPPQGPDGTPVPAVFVTSEGQDLQQLLATFLRGAVAFSQGTDDYLDDDIEGKGLRSDHVAVEDGARYTTLEHAWDEGFGYFGASRSYVDWSDAMIADPGYVDVDADGWIDLLAEVCWGHSVDAGARDLGSVAATDLTQRAWNAFYDGRALIAGAAGPLTPARATELAGYRDAAVAAWEAVIAATVVHDLNATVRDMDAIGTPAYSFADHARHWSQTKGNALAFQFNPRSALSADAFAALHGYLDTRPWLDGDPPGQRAAYRADLLAARDLLEQTFGFDAANMGDEDGRDGW